MMCFVRFSEQTAFISPYSIYWLVFITEEDVSCEVRTEFRPGEICGGGGGDGKSWCPSTSVLPSVSFYQSSIPVFPQLFPSRTPFGFEK
jgi:hypothetical protein